MNQSQPCPPASPQGPGTRAAAHAEQRQGLHGKYSVRFGIGGWVFFTLQVVCALWVVLEGSLLERVNGSWAFIFFMVFLYGTVVQAPTNITGLVVWRAHRWSPCGAGSRCVPCSSGEARRHIGL